ncbi:hypothetical protein [Paenarthrobacter aurescens]|nr:hypothetical protein [Paenarthrobacter aurescens]
MSQDDDNTGNTPPREEDAVSADSADRRDDRDRYPRRICTYNPEHWP